LQSVCSADRGRGVGKKSGKSRGGAKLIIGANSGVAGTWALITHTAMAIWGFVWIELYFEADYNRMTPEDWKPYNDCMDLFTDHKYRACYEACPYRKPKTASACLTYPTGGRELTD
jgi:hypothetical protein